MSRSQGDCPSLGGEPLAPPMYRMSIHVHIQHGYRSFAYTDDVTLVAILHHLLEYE